MWTLGKKSTRQKEIRRSISARRDPWYARLFSEIGAAPFSITLLTGLLAAAILNAGGEKLTLREGQTLRRSITSRVDLQIRDEQKTLEMRLRARDGTANHYVLDTALLDDIQGRLTSLLTLASSSAEDPKRLGEEAAKVSIPLDEAGAAELLRIVAVDGGATYARGVESLITQLRRVPLVEHRDVSARATTSLRAVLFDPGSSQETRRPRTELIPSNDAAAAEKALDGVTVVFAEALRPTVRATLDSLLRVPNVEPPQYRPIHLFDAERTAEVAKQSEAAVETQFLMYPRGSTLADLGALSRDELQLLQAEHAHYLAEGGEPARLRRMSVAGRAALALLVVLGVAAYMRRYQHRVFSNTLRRAVSSLALLLIFGLARAVFVLSDAPPNVAIGFQAFAAALLGIVYTHGAVFAICGGLAVLMTMATQQGIGFFVILLVVSANFGFGLREVRHRGRVVLVGGLGALAAFATTVAVGLVDGQRLLFIAGDAAWAAGMTLLAAFVIEGILPGVERLFRLSTGMTLLEWCDASKPVMRRMAAEAPGTYNHSLLVSALAESAATAIGANALLCRAGALYHDIGKINKPGYFVENQPHGVSRHERLSPAMSLLIIVGHVKDGIEMAKEYGLPTALHPFIAEHHGTTLVEYFYHAASKSRKPDDPELSDTHFRYPGPKPLSRETAILMICDAVEGAVRSMAEPTPNRIEAVVTTIVQKRLIDGQFDACDLTFRELARIEASVIKSLCGIYHARIAYPEKEPGKPGVAS